MNHLLSFADSRMQRSLARLAKQAKEMSIFDRVHFLNENDLSLEFRNHFKQKLILGSRGYGHWSWKPEIIKLTLDKMSDGDLLIYIDAGCHLNPHGRQRLMEYLSLLDKQDLGIIAFQAVKPDNNNSTLIYDGRKLFDQPNYCWIKGDLLDYFGVRRSPEVINSQAIGAGVILIKKCKPAISIIQEWRQIIWHRYDLLDDSPSVSANLPGFIENRHDQAIWTLLCLKYGVKTLSAYEYWYPKKNTKKHEPDWLALQDFPIHAKRDKDLGLIKNFYTKVKSSIDRVKSAIGRSVAI